jgi:hypothetical protein
VVTGRAALAVAIGGRALVEVPVVPDGDTAREWARQELADPVYHQGQSLLQKAIDWIYEWLAEAQNTLSGVDGRMAALVLGAVLVIGALVVRAVVGPVRRARRERTSTEVFVDDARTAAEMRASADAAAAAGRWNDAVLDRFRAILRSLEERAILAERPGWTADEATAEAAAALPPCAADLRDASRLFDDVCYGDRSAGQQEEAWLRTLDRTVSDTRPAAHREAPVASMAAPS